MYTCKSEKITLNPGCEKEAVRRILIANAAVSFWINIQPQRLRKETPGAQSLQSSLANLNWQNRISMTLRFSHCHRQLAVCHRIFFGDIWLIDTDLQVINPSAFSKVGFDPDFLTWSEYIYPYLHVFANEWTAGNVNCKENGAQPGYLRM